MPHDMMSNGNCILCLTQQWVRWVPSFNNVLHLVGFIIEHTVLLSSVSDDPSHLDEIGIATTGPHFRRGFLGWLGSVQLAGGIF